MSSPRGRAVRDAADGGATRARASHRESDGWVALLLIGPVMLGFLVFYLYPTIRGLWWSFNDFSLTGQPRFIGGDNYAMVIHDVDFWRAMGRTLEYVVINIGAQTLIALGLATLMHRLTRSVVLRTTLLIPWLVPNVTTALIWLWLLDTNLGFVNHLLKGMGFGPVGFFTNPNYGIPTMSLINTWAYVGYTALLLYAGMLQIPEDIYEAASIDGAGEWKLFTRVTLPLLKPILALVLVVSLIGSFQLFDTVAATTRGDPAGATRVIYYYIYQQAFQFFKMGYAATMAILLVVILGVLTFIQIRLLRASESSLA